MGQSNRSFPKSSEQVECFIPTVDKYPSLNLIRRLCESLDQEGINYCHWKSNAALDRSAQGKNDLDLLVKRSDSTRFTEILSRYGFKETFKPAALNLPGVVNFYGYDHETEKFVHVHVHYQLVMGHDMNKNVHLPIEEPYLATAFRNGLFKVPAPEFELILLAIRMVLKHSSWDNILTRQGSLSKSETQELVYLQARSDRTQIRHLLEQYLPDIDMDLFDACLRSIQPGCPVGYRIKTAFRLQNKLNAYMRYPQLIDLYLKFWRRLVAGLRRRISRYTPKAQFSGGGALIAIVGGDGAGKSTAVDELYTWLSGHFDVIKIHMGKPPWSLTTIAVRGMLKIGRSLGLYPFSRALIEYTLDTNSITFPGYPWLIREVCVARDRYLTYIKARRFTAKGGIVLCDRFPLSQMQLMDGPQVERMSGAKQKNWFLKYLMKMEMKYYRPMLLPELLIVLKVHPETAVIRKANESEASVRARSSEIWELDLRETPAHVIDANRSKTEVLSNLKALIWSEI